MVYVGIDPGVSGGIAILDPSGKVLSACRMPETEQDILDVLKPASGGEGRAILERVRSSPQMGVVSAFTFGRGYGAVRMALIASAIPFNEVIPTIWQKSLGCRTGGGVISERKSGKTITKRRAQELFPRFKITHAVADALLLAEYGRLLETRRLAHDSQR